ncbi:MAG: hypothetical protein ACTSYV_03710 [Candidatus Heimdallarchaeaceae archaeon]
MNEEEEFPPIPKPKKISETDEREEVHETEEYPPLPARFPPPSEESFMKEPQTVQEETEKRDIEYQTPSVTSQQTYEVERQRIPSEDQTQELGEQEERKKHWSFFWWGCLFFFLWNILLMFILEVTLYPRETVVTGVIAYSLGLVGLITFVLLVRNVKKIAISLPLLLLLIFGLSVVFHILNVPIYNPLAPIAERAKLVTDSIKSSTYLFDTSAPLFGVISVESIERWGLLLFVLDYIISLIICFVGCLSLAWVVNLFSAKKSVSTTFLILLALFLLMFGLILTPIIQLSLAGFLDFGSNALLGSNYIVGGIEIMGNFENATQENINTALANFLLAATSIEEARNGLTMFSVIFGMFRVTKALIHFMDASLLLLGGINPMINGSYQIYTGFQDVAKALNQSTIGGTLQIQNQAIKQQVVNDTLFNSGVNKVELGLEILGSNTDVLNDAITEIDKANLTSITGFISKLPFENAQIQAVVSDVIGYINSFSNIPAVVDILAGKPTINGSVGRYATLTHFLYGAYNLIKATEIIGDNSNYNGTALFFQNAQSNLTLVSGQLSRHEIQQVINSETLFFNETLSFLYDMTKLSLDISLYGCELGEVFQGLNNTITYFDQGYENITNYPEIISEVDVFVNRSDSLRSTSQDIESQISLMEIKTNNDTYGVFRKPAELIVSSLKNFDLGENAENIYNIAKALYHLFISMSYLKDTTNYIKLGETQFVNDSNYVAANNSFQLANTSFYNSTAEMDIAIFYMNQTATGKMDQLATTRTAFMNIKNDLEGVLTNFNDLLILANLGPLADPNDVSGNCTIILTSFSNVNNQLSNIRAE